MVTGWMSFLPAWNHHCHVGSTGRCRSNGTAVSHQKRCQCIRCSEYQNWRIRLVVSDVFNAITFKRFLTVLKKRGNEKRMQIILDNARYHHAKLLTQWLEDRDCVKIIKPCISRLSEAIGLFMKPYYTM